MIGSINDPYPAFVARFRWLAAIAAASLPLAATACTEGGSSPEKGAIADTAIVVGQGVPTSADDTLGTLYGKHEGPRRILPLPECRPHGFAQCLMDTARAPLHYEGEGGMPDERVTQWLVFAAEDDSLQLFIASPHSSYLWMSPPSAAGFVAEHAINDASWIRARLGHAGTFVYDARIESDSAIPYELRVAPVIATGASVPIGASATLEVRSDSNARVAVAPASLAKRVTSDSAWNHFAVENGTYRVLLVRDTTYIACRLPCRSPEPFTLGPGRRITVRR